MHRMNDGNRNSAVTALSPENVSHIASLFWACFLCHQCESFLVKHPAALVATLLAALPAAHTRRRLASQELRTRKQTRAENCAQELQYEVQILSYTGGRARAGFVTHLFCISVSGKEQGFSMLVVTSIDSAWSYSSVKIAPQSPPQASKIFDNSTERVNVQNYKQICYVVIRHFRCHVGLSPLPCWKVGHVFVPSLSFLGILCVSLALSLFLLLLCLLVQNGLIT